MTTDTLSRVPQVPDTVPTAALVAAGLVGGFAAARATKVRALGGVVLAAAGFAAGRRWLRDSGAPTTAVLTGVYLVAFGGSHPLAKKLGAWPSVFTVTAVAAGTAWAVHDRTA
ncbi:hypothetical protein [Luteimicrobium subarcticum]|uniref:Uncharacterized protein n=1 Tax=Luteimicrobium subarcticum TaxID=620910 RepID=A0A2M8WJ30_9MICO|nr:hypothetical protein [Luteimicrobium subarcticum]PJI90940.1 hypothetical protein CLV34_2198 [Luteimicrobium subarcticum]